MEENCDANSDLQVSVFGEKGEAVWGRVAESCV